MGSFSAPHKKSVAGQKTQGARFIVSCILNKFHNLPQEEWIIWLGHERLKSPWAVCVRVCVCSQLGLKFGPSNAVSSEGQYITGKGAGKGGASSWTLLQVVIIQVATWSPHDCVLSICSFLLPGLLFAASVDEGSTHLCLLEN